MSEKGGGEMKENEETKKETRGVSDGGRGEGGATRPELPLPGFFFFPPAEEE